LRGGYEETGEDRSAAVLKHQATSHTRWVCAKFHAHTINCERPSANKEDICDDGLFLP
jgi:hypothetical protein